MAAALRLGVEVVVGSDHRSTLEAIVPGATLALPLDDPEASAEAIAAFARDRPFDAIVAVDDGGTLAAARASELLGLPYNPLTAVEATRDKSLLRERLEAGGLASPPWLVASIDADPRELAGRVSLPCVVKPLSLAGSRGVIRADDREQFVAAFERVRALLTAPLVLEGCGANADRVLIEGYIPGIEVSVEGLLTNGELQVLAIFDKPDPLEGPYFEETIYVTPSRLSAGQQAEVLGVCADAARALGLRDGPLHSELRLNEDGAWPIDVAARSIGGLCSRTLELGAGVSLEALLLSQAIGAPIETFERSAGAEQASGVMMIPIPAAGRLVAVDGVDEARAVPGIAGAEITMHRGQRVVPLPDGSEYLGFIFARGDRPEHVEAALRTAHGALRIQIAVDGEGEAGDASVPDAERRTDVSLG